MTVLAVALAIAPAAGCTGNCDRNLPGGAIKVALTAATATGAGQLDLCADDT